MKKIELKTKSTLFRRYFLIISSIIVASFAILGIAIIILATQFWSTEKTDDLNHNAKTLADNTAVFFENGLVQAEYKNVALIIGSNMNTISRISDSDIFICNLSGEVIFCKDILDYAISSTYEYDCKEHKSYKISEDLIDEIIENNGISRLDKINTISLTNQFIAGQPITVKGQVVAIVIATQPVSQTFYEYISNFLKVFFLAILVALLVAFVMVYVSTYRIVKPLKDMQAAIGSYSEGDFSHKIEVHGGDELSELGSSLNAMASDLALLETSRRNFVANVSHELKTPMTTIGGFIDGILDGTIDKDKQEHYLKIVSAEVKRLSRLVTGMMNMSKIEAGMLKINPRQFDLGKRTFDVLLSFEQLIEKKNINITGLEEFKSVYVNADEDMIMQVIYNLVDNAVKFTPNGGWINIDILSNEKQASLAIRNSGAGISAEDMQKIFERFYKTDKSRSYDTKGAGLGLYISRTIIELHDGTLSASSEENEFTEFKFTLPIV